MRKDLSSVWFAFLLTGCSGEPLFLGGGGDSGCAPGTYVGMYVCITSSDASFPVSGIDAASFQQMSGPITLELQGDLGGKALHIAPGGKLVSVQSGSVASVDLSGTTAADLSGTLDCTRYKFTGTLSNYTFTSTTITFAANGSGDLSADYDASASPPALVNGVMNPPQVFPGIFSGACTWSAALRR